MQGFVEVGQINMATVDTLIELFRSKDARELPRVFETSQMTRTTHHPLYPYLHITAELSLTKYAPACLPIIFF